MGRVSLALPRKSCRLALPCLDSLQPRRISSFSFLVSVLHKTLNMAAKTPTLSASAVAELTSMLEKYTASPNPQMPGTFLTVSSTNPQTPLFLDAKGARNATVGSADDLRGPVTPKTLLFIASCTKSIVATSIFLLMQEGKIKSLDESVDPYIPEMRANGVLNVSTGDIDPVQKDKDITIRMLLDHTSGSTYPFKEGGLHAWAEKKGQPSAFTLTKAAFIDLPLLFQPGEGWSYGFGLDWAVLLIERLLGDGITFSQFAKKRIFDPLGMKRTTFTPKDLVASTASAEGSPDEAGGVYSSKHGMEIHWREEDGSLVPVTKQHPRPAGGIWAGEGAASPDVDSGGAGLVSTIEGEYTDYQDCKPEHEPIPLTLPVVSVDYGRYLSFLVSLSKYPASPAEAEKLSIPSALFIDPSISRQLFTPHLSDAQTKGLVKTLEDEGVVAPKGGYPNLQHTSGLAFLPKGTAAGVTEGSVFWSGITCLFYFVDPTKEIAVSMLQGRLLLASVE